MATSNRRRRPAAAEPEVRNKHMLCQSVFLLSSSIGAQIERSDGMAVETDTPALCSLYNPVELNFVAKIGV